MHKAGTLAGGQPGCTGGEQAAASVAAVAGPGQPAVPSHQHPIRCCYTARDTHSKVCQEAGRELLPHHRLITAVHPLQATERLKYKYFNWRQDTWSDLQLFLGFNVVVFLAGALFEVGGRCASLGHC